MGKGAPLTFASAAFQDKDICVEGLRMQDTIDDVELQFGYGLW